MYAVDSEGSVYSSPVHLLLADNTSTLILPHHPPEVLHCVLQWSLSGYIGTFLLVTLHSTGMEVEGRASADVGIEQLAILYLVFQERSHGPLYVYTSTLHCLH